MTVAAPCHDVSDLDPGEVVSVFPTYARLDAEGNYWEIRVRGSVQEPARDTARWRLLVKLFRRIVRVDPSHPSNDLFEERLQGFLVTQEKGKRIVLRVGGANFAMRKRTKSNGRFRGTLTLPCGIVEQLKREQHVVEGCMRLNVVTPNEHSEQFSCRVHLIDRVGVSVISDIDDTIKYTDVSSRRSLLASTFTQSFEAVPGMAKVFRRWADEGAAFHYVSSSPWQLYRPLAEFCAAHTFPEGTYHLRVLRFRDPSALQLFIAKRRGKKKAIRALFRAFPFRRFVLVGDSGEKDPELYGSVARKYPGQVAGIFIREVPFRPLDDERAARAFRGLPPRLWKLFHSADELPSEIPLLTQPLPSAADWPSDA